MFRRGERRIYRRYVKRMLDVLFSGLLLLLLWLPMLFIAIAVRSDSEGGAIFRQTRRGRNGKNFVCYKFRTMYKEAPHDVPASQFCDYGRQVTRVGGWLRKTSLDELPQLFNVLRGDMSLVGPRPLICEEQRVHDQRMSRGVYSLRPGITGMAQVSGRNAIEDDEKVRQDAYYLDNFGIALDVKIIFRTLIKVLRRDGVEPIGQSRDK